MGNYEEWNVNLADYTVDRIQYFSFRARYPRLHGKNARLGYHGFGGSVTVARITTAQGASGWAQLSRGIKEAHERESLIVGKKLADIFDVRTGILDERLAAFDLPLHDLAGNILGIPVYKMIAPEAQPRARVYDGAIYMNDIIPENRPMGIDKVVQDSIDDVALGHTRLKIKIGRGNMWMNHDEGLARDIEIVNAIHAALPGAGLMVDANDGYSVQDAISFMEGIENVELVWFEEAFQEEERNNRLLKQYLMKNRPMTKIADGETNTDISLLRDLAQKGVLDIWQPDLCGYGFTPWRKLMKEIAENGWLASPHTWGNAVKTHYCTHLAAAYPHHIPCVEAVLGESEGVDYGGYALKDGIMSIPDKPGFGMDLVWAPEIVL